MSCAFAQAASLIFATDKLRGSFFGIAHGSFSFYLVCKGSSRLAKLEI